MSNVRNVENVGNVSNVSNVTNIANLENLGNVSNVSYVTNLVNLENLGNVSNVRNVENVGNVGNVGNVTNLANLENLVNVSNVRNGAVSRPQPSQPRLRSRTAVHPHSTSQSTLTRHCSKPAPFNDKARDACDDVSDNILTAIVNLQNLSISLSFCSNTVRLVILRRVKAKFRDGRRND